MITELRLYNEVVYQICTNYDKFKEDGLSKEEMEAALAKIEKTITSIDMENDSSLAAEIRQTILENIQVAEKQIEAVFSKNAVPLSKTEKGNE